MKHAIKNLVTAFDVCPGSGTQQERLGWTCFSKQSDRRVILHAKEDRHLSSEQDKEEVEDYALMMSTPGSTV